MGALFIWTCSISPCGKLEKRERKEGGGRVRERGERGGGGRAGWDGGGGGGLTYVYTVHHVVNCVFIEERGKEFCD